MFDVKELKGALIMKKKLGSLLLAFTLLTSLALVGCGSAKKNDATEIGRAHV